MSKINIRVQHHHTRMGPYTRMMIFSRHSMSIVKYWSLHLYGYCIIPVWESDLENPYVNKDRTGTGFKN